METTTKFCKCGIAYYGTPDQVKCGDCLKNDRWAWTGGMNPRGDWWFRDSQGNRHGPFPTEELYNAALWAMQDKLNNY